MLKRSVGARLEMWILDRVVSGPARLCCEKYDEERRACSQKRIGNVTVYGNPAFTDDVTTTLTALADVYPYGYSLVQRYIHAIEEEGFVTSPEISATKQGPGFGVRAEKTTPEGKLSVTAERYASFLVRVAVDRRRALLYARKSPRANTVGLKKAEHAMTLLLRARGF